MSATPAAQREETVACQACATVRPLAEMRPATNLRYEPIEDLHNCRDNEACYQAVVATALAQGAARRAATQ